MQPETLRKDFRFFAGSHVACGRMSEIAAILIPSLLAAVFAAVSAWLALRLARAGAECARMEAQLAAERAGTAEKSALPVLYTSGYSSIENDQAYLSAENFLQKPFPPDAIERAVKLAFTRA